MYIDDKMKSALTIKKKNFGNDITFVFPNETMAISTTGTSCDLQCSHCNGHYLKNMTPIENVDVKIESKELKSFLISGGCSFDGDVPLITKIDKIKEYKEQGYKLNAHLGLMSEEDIALVCKYIDVVSFDLVLNDETIKNVYKINKSKEEYINTYRILKKYAKVIPHICIGLDGGEIKGEYDILDFLKDENPECITFIVLIPTKGTDFENVNPPKLEEVANLLSQARILFPNTVINLGCMRPRGEYRKKLDEIGILCGVNKIVLPSRNAQNMAKAMNLNIIQSKECCVL